MSFTKDNIVFEPHPSSPLFQDWTGRVFTRLTVLGYAGKRRTNHHWFCECECGNITCPSACKLRSLATKSCGCWGAETASRCLITHGQSRVGKRSREYEAYHAAKNRCTNPTMDRYPHYGGRGIEFRFNSFTEFFNEVGFKPTPKHSLDRIDVNGHYEKGNLQWAMPKDQMRNSQRQRNLTINGITRCVMEWSEVIGTQYRTIRFRLNKGWCDTCAVMLPTYGRCPHH